MRSKVLLVGGYAWEAGLTASYKRAFEASGCEVLTFSVEALRNAATPLGRLGRRFAAHVDVPSITMKANRPLVTLAMDARPDVMVVMCTEAVLPSSLAQIKLFTPATKVVNVFPDTMFNLREHVLAALPLYDAFFTHTRAALEPLRKLGCRRPVYLPLAGDPFLHSPVSLDASDRATFGCDLVYVGHWRPEHEQLFEHLQGYDLKIWGSDHWMRRTNPKGWVRTRWQGRPLLDAREFTKAHLGAKIGLNPVDPMNFPAHNQRAFELPTMSAFSLVSRTSELTDLFKENVEIACFDGPEELLSKIRHYLGAHEERERIAQRAHALIHRGGHTYRDRVEAIFRALGEEGAA